MCSRPSPLTRITPPAPPSVVCAEPSVPHRTRAQRSGNGDQLWGAGRVWGRGRVAAGAHGACLYLRLRARVTVCVAARDPHLSPPIRPSSSMQGEPRKRVARCAARFVPPVERSLPPSARRFQSRLLDSGDAGQAQQWACPPPERHQSWQRRPGCSRRVQLGFRSRPWPAKTKAELFRLHSTKWQGRPPASCPFAFQHLHSSLAARHAMSL